MDTTAAQSLPRNTEGTDDVVGQATFGQAYDGFKGDLDDDMYRVTLADVVTFDGKDYNDPTKTKVSLIWKFTIDGREEEGPLGYFTSFSMHEKSKLPGLCVALQKSGPTEDKPGISRSAFIGAKCKALIKTKPSKKDPTKSYPRIVELVKA